MSRKAPNVDEYKKADKLRVMDTVIAVVLAVAVVVTAVWCISDLATNYNNY